MLFLTFMIMMLFVFIGTKVIFMIFSHQLFLIEIFYYIKCSNPNYYIPQSKNISQKTIIYILLLLKTKFIKNKKIKMNKRQQEQFIYLFDELCQTEEIIDQCKKKLSQCHGFNPHLIFELIADDQDQITIKNMRRYLTERIACNQRQLYEIFQRFDSKRNGFITRQDFIRQLRPLKAFESNFDRQGVLNSHIESYFIQIFIQILKRFRIVEEARKQTVFIPPYDAFAHIDYWKKGIVGLGQLQKLYRDNQFQITKQSLDFLLHALRRRYYRDVNLELFCQCLNPLQFGQYPNYAAQIQKDKELQFLKRSRNEQQAVRRSRVDNQMLEYQIRRTQRRKKAEMQRQLNIEQRINLELADYDKLQQNNIRRAILEQQSLIRSNTLIQSDFLQRENLRSIEESRRINQLQTLRQKQRIINESLNHTLIKQQTELNNSRRKYLIDKQIALQQQIQRDRQTHKAVARTKELQINRQQLQLERLRQKQTLIRELEASKLRRIQPQNFSLSRSIKQSRIQSLEQQLQRTRAEMKERRDRLDLEQRLKIEQATSAKSRRSGFPY